MLAVKHGLHQKIIVIINVCGKIEFAWDDDSQKSTIMLYYLHAGPKTRRIRKYV